ncbi:DUF881 domain-containing protein [Antribacter sp. KLBMP9083]|uniref:DUF881 domain-containing protein n=1 Tax=Antribacter soli TaxID=2910976 RepID=A0AA41QCB0_9MICO|nr:DUF881 domain-containing protein [Antribacter soli]MCF4120799.1 DUF881 domain-containing protein [Antribacter soli]
MEKENPGQVPEQERELEAGERAMPEESPAMTPEVQGTPGATPEGSSAMTPEVQGTPGATPEGSSAPEAVTDVGQRAPGRWAALWGLLRPRGTRSELLAGVLCLALGFALAVQVRQSGTDQLSSLRQDELVRLLDEVTQRAEQLDAEVATLEEARDDLQSEDGQDQAALELAQQRAEFEGILSGRLPAEGPGVKVEVVADAGTLQAQQLFNVLEELRNAGAEAMELNGVRLVTSSWFEDADGRIVLDGEVLSSPYVWTVIGDPETVDRALEIPGGALPSLRSKGAQATTTQLDHVVVDAVREPAEPEYARPAEDAGQG